MASKKRVCIDAGHYEGYNPSPIYKAYKEGNMTWKWQQYIKKELESYGIEVVVTRTSISKDLSLSSRGGASKNCDLFLSGHSNAVDNSKVERAVVIYGIATDKTLADNLAKCIHTTMGLTEKYQIMQKKQSNGDEYYGVLRGAKNVGTRNRFILEHGFHTNLKCAKWLSVDENIKKLAIAESKVIASYLGVSKPNNDQIQGNGSATSKNGVYRVVTGSYRERGNAEAQVKNLKAKGINSVIVFTEGI